MQVFGSQLVAIGAMILSVWALFKKAPAPKREYILSINKLMSYNDTGFQILLRISNTGETKINIKPEWFDVKHKLGNRFEVKQVRDADHRQIGRTLSLEPASDLDIILVFEDYTRWPIVESLLSEAQQKKYGRIALELKDATGKLTFSDGTNKMQEVDNWPFGVYLLQALEERLKYN